MNETGWPPNEIKLLLLDVDGTLTDGGLYFTGEGQAMKRFDVHDGLGLVRLQRAGVEVVIISADRSPIIHMRAQKLGIRAVIDGCQDKGKAVRMLLEERELDPSVALYMGDDITDLEAMAEAGHSAAPANAAEAVQEVADYVTTRGGGHGAVREVCDLIMGCLGKR